MILEGDCLVLMAELEPCSVDAIVTDPPYGLGFMGRKWDALPPGVEWAEACLRVLKPGGHLLAFGGTRTYHRLACAVEDAGFEIRDCLAWLYGSGFPKSLDVSKAIDKAAGAKRRVVGRRDRLDQSSKPTHRMGYSGPMRPQDEALDITAPATPEAVRWDGWGTALKPAHEPIVLARKPLDGTVAANVLEHGTGALNVNGCRVPTGDNLNGGRHSPNARGADGSAYMAGINKPSRTPYVQPVGRWPANVALDEDAARMLDEQTGTLPAGVAVRRHKGYVASSNVSFTQSNPEMREDVGYGDSGGASRFFYCAKASRRERGADNDHPTVKPLKLMRWLVRMVTPPNGVVLDPFAGSGTTGCACALEGFDFIGIEQDPKYAALARSRIDHATPSQQELMAA